MLSFLKYFLAACLLNIFIASAVWLGLSKTQEAKLFSVQSDSMQPALNRGDLVLDVKINPAALKPGDIVSYVSSQNPGQIITHRVIEVNLGKSYLITKGDNLAQADPAVPIKSLSGKAVKAAPKIGYIFNEIRKPLGLVFFIYLPALLIAAGELWALSKDYSRHAYELI